MKNLIKIDLVHGTLTISKSFEKRAQVYGSPEFKELSDKIAKYPDFEIKVKEITSNSNKKTYKGLTYNNMVAFIKEQPNASELIEEFEHQKRLSVIAKNKYRYLVNWFKSACFNSEEEFEKFRETTTNPAVVS